VLNVSIFGGLGPHVATGLTHLQQHGANSTWIVVIPKQSPWQIYANHEK